MPRKHSKHRQQALFGVMGNLSEIDNFFKKHFYLMTIEHSALNDAHEVYGKPEYE